MNACKLVREKAHLATKLNEASARLERRATCRKNWSGGGDDGGGGGGGGKDFKSHPERKMNSEKTPDCCTGSSINNIGDTGRMSSGVGTGISWQEKQKEVERSLRQLEEMSGTKEHHHSGSHYVSNGNHSEVKNDDASRNQRFHYDLTKYSKGPTSRSDAAQSDDGQHTFHDLHRPLAINSNHKENIDPQRKQQVGESFDSDSISLLRPVTLHDEKMSPPSLYKDSQPFLDFLSVDDDASTLM
jgi:hypothetical protein